MSRIVGARVEASASRWEEGGSAWAAAAAPARRERATDTCVPVSELAAAVGVGPRPGPARLRRIVSSQSTTRVGAAVADRPGSVGGCRNAASWDGRGTVRRGAELFATGRDPEHASIAVTQGLLSTMNRVEREGKPYLRLVAGDDQLRDRAP